MIMLPEINKKATKQNAVKILTNYRRLERLVSTARSLKRLSINTYELRKQERESDNKRIEQAMIELEAISLAIEQLTEGEQELLCKKYLSKELHSNIAIYMDLHISESKFYRELEKALIHFAEAYKNGELLIEK